MTIRQRHYFPANRAYVITIQLDTELYCAGLEDLSEGWTPGYGPTRLAAIADLTERNEPLLD